MAKPMYLMANPMYLMAKPMFLFDNVATCISQCCKTNVAKWPCFAIDCGPANVANGPLGPMMRIGLDWPWPDRGAFLMQFCLEFLK